MKALSLFSGGLDSQLAVCMIKEQGIAVIGLNFTTPFFGADSKIESAARQLNIPLHTVALQEEYMEVLFHPVYGFGKNMNPCIDCHAMMQRRALALLPELDADFVISGEVVGQRPMSQTRQSLGLVDKLAGNTDLIVRPLSAKLLPPSLPEREGWIDRERLGSISGRSRKEQMELAQQYHLEDYPTPAGGCLLTQENFARRLKRYLNDHPLASSRDLYILKYGRHFYLSDGSLLIVGRHQQDNVGLTEYAAAQDLMLKVTERPGPVAVIRSFESIPDNILNQAAAIVARYSDGKDLEQLTVKLYRAGEDNVLRWLQIKPLRPEEVPATY